MLSKIVSVCLVALLASSQNCTLHTTDIGEGRLLATNDKVLHWYIHNALTGNNNATYFVCDKEGDVTLVYCHDRICEDRTETLIDAGACGSGSCALGFCTLNVYNTVLDRFSTFIYGSSVDKRVNKVNCHDYECVDKNVTTIANVDTDKVSCNVRSGDILVSTAASGANMLWGCNRPCTTPVHYFTDGVFPFSVFSTKVLIRGVETPLVGLVARNYFQGVLHYDLYLLNCARWDCYYPVFLLVDEDVEGSSFAIQLDSGNSINQRVQVVYSKWENGMFYLKLFTCRPGYIIQCRDPVTTIIDASSSGFSRISMYYGLDSNLVIMYVQDNVLKEVDCHNFYCNNHIMTTLFPVGGTYGGVSTMVYYTHPDGYEQLHVVFEGDDGRIKYFSRTCGVVTPYPSLYPTPRPTGFPSGVSMAPTPAPTLWSEGPTRGPTDVPTTGTPTTEVPTEVPTGVPTGHPVVSPLVEEGEQRGTKWLEENLTYGNIAWTVVNGLSLVCLGVSWCVGKLKEREVASIEDAIMTIE